MTSRGEQLRARRVAAGWSQPGLARRLGVSRPYVAMLESGARRGPAELWARIDDVLGAGGALLATPTAPGAGRLPVAALRLSDPEIAGLLAERLTVPITAATAERIAHEWLLAELPQTAHQLAGRRIGQSTVDTLRTRVDQLRRLDDFVAGRDLSLIVRRELDATTDLVAHASYTEASGRALLSAVAELAQLAGWTTSDAGDHQAATRYYLAGVKAADAASDRAVGANLISSLAYETTNEGEPGSGLLLARTAQAGAAGSSGLVDALLGERVAWAAANLGDRSTTDHALAAVERAYDRRGGDPEWTYWLDPDEIIVMAARCWVATGRPARAIDALADVLARYDRRHTRERSLYVSWLAEAHLDAGDLDAAAGAANEALTLATQTASTRSDDRIATLARRLRPHAAATSVADFLDRAAS